LTEFGPIDIQINGKSWASGDKLQLVVRPEAIRISSPKESLDVNEFDGRVRSFMYAGSMVKYVIDIGNKQVITDQFDPINEGLHGVGDRCCVTLPQKVHVL
jgi:ABC-type Fe3+/spermidine/putrescine transport system ATPase subunit